MNILSRIIIPLFHRQFYQEDRNKKKYFKRLKWQWWQEQTPRKHVHLKIQWKLAGEKNLCSLCPVPAHTDTESNRNQDVHLTEQLHLLISKSSPKSTLPSDVQKAFQLITAKPSQPVWCLCKEVTSQGPAEPTLACRTGHCLQGEHQCQNSILLAKTQLTSYIWKWYQEVSVCLV